MNGNKVLNWCKEHKVLIKAFIMMWVPLLCCMMTCALEGRSIRDVYLPASEWNDELFYFKQVEGILSNGFPQGYFGFNESHARSLSFAAWSPVLVFPWIIWGLLFGWNLMSPIYCNIFLMMLAVFLFVLMVNPKKKQLLYLVLMLPMFTPMTRFMLSGMPEVICFAAVIILMGLAVNYSRKEKNYKLVTMFVMASLMTLMRPYLLLFLLLPAYYWIKRNKKVGIVGTVLVIGVTGGIYVLINKYFSAPYLTPLFDVTWIEKFFTEGILSGIKFTLYKLWDVGKTVFAYMLEGFISGYHAGTQFAAFVWLMLVFLWQSAADLHKKKRQELELHGFLVIAFVGMFVAVLLMYKPIQGGRHLLTFIAAGIFMVSIMESKLHRKMIFTAGLLAYLFIGKATDAYEHQIPYKDEARQETLVQWDAVLAQKLVLNRENVPNYDNVVIWTLWDEVDGEHRSLKWQELYAVPAGFGISCCEDTFVDGQFEKLQSKYIAVVSGGALEKKCKEKNLKEIGRSEEVAIYELH